MLWFLVGLILGAGLVGLGVFALQCLIIRAVAPALGYRFDKYIFHTTQFPQGDFEQGRVVRRCLYPAKAEVKFYDREYNEVIEAAKPGRYGAVVRIQLNGGVVVHRFITLYRTPVEVLWWNGPMTVVAKLPPNTGVDPVVLEKQEQQIGKLIRDGYAGEGEVSQHLSILLSGLSETTPDEPPALDRFDANARTSRWWFGLRKRIGLEQKYPYLVDLPDGYAQNPDKKWPMILSLHGGNYNGNTLNVVRGTGVAAVIGCGKKIDAIVISPQCPWYEGWNTEVLAKLIDEVTAKYRIDPDRICVTGHSSGAVGTWSLALDHPDRISAIFPVNGDNDCRDVANLAKIHIWAFIGLKDDLLPASKVVRLTEAIREAGGNAHLTVYPTHSHDAEYVAYETDALYAWLFAQRRGQPEVITPGLPDYPPRLE